jgi:hypothetical protein
VAHRYLIWSWSDGIDPMRFLCAVIFPHKGSSCGLINLGNRDIISIVGMPKDFLLVDLAKCASDPVRYP